MNTHDNDAWDAQIEADSKAGRLDFLISKIKDSKEFEALLKRYAAGDISFGKLASTVGLSFRELSEIFAARQIAWQTDLNDTIKWDSHSLPTVKHLLSAWRNLRDDLEQSDIWPPIQWLAVATTDQQRKDRREALEEFRKLNPILAQMHDELQAIEFTFELWRAAYSDALNK